MSQIHKPGHSEWQPVTACSVALAHNGTHWARPSSHVLCAFIQECLEYSIYTATQMVAKSQPGLCSKTLVSLPFFLKTTRGQSVTLLSESVLILDLLAWATFEEMHLVHCWVSVVKQNLNFRMSQYLFCFSSLFWDTPPIKSLIILYTHLHVVLKFYAFFLLWSTK